MAARRVSAPEDLLSCQASVEEEPLTPIERVNGEVDSEGNSLRKARPRKRGRTRPQCHVPPGSLQTLTTGSVFPLGPMDRQVRETQGAGALTVDHHRFIHPPESVFADRAVVAGALDVQQTSVGLEADLPQGGQILQPLADAEVTRVVDGGLRAQGAPFLVVLLDARPLVVHVQ